MDGSTSRAPDHNPSAQAASVESPCGAIVDPASPRRAQCIVVKVLGVLIAAGLIVYVFPLPFNDPPAIRKVVAAVVIGIGAAYLAKLVARDMKKALVEGEAPAIRRESIQPEPVLRLGGVDMREATLPGADLGRSELTSALLEGADLNAATLHSSRLAGANLRASDLRQADLRFSDLSDADLSAADLRGADLRGAELTDPKLGGAIYDEGTKWPQGFAPEKRGAIDVSKADR